jgi:exodeoxyribonuclease VII large subunit
VSGVGHEVDFTIADFVADERAPTPSGAAERVVPDRAEWLRSLASTGQRLALAMRRRLTDHGNALQARDQRLARAHPGVVLRQHAQRLDELEGRLRLAARTRLERASHRFTTARGLLLRASPALRVAALRLRLDAASRNLARAVHDSVATRLQRLALAARGLHAVSPLATLDRGYAIVADAAGKVLMDPARVRPGDRITARLARGSLEAEVVNATPASAGKQEPGP